LKTRISVATGDEHYIPARIAGTVCDKPSDAESVEHWCRSIGARLRRAVESSAADPAMTSRAAKRGCQSSPVTKSKDFRVFTRLLKLNFGDKKLKSAIIHSGFVPVEDSVRLFSDGNGFIQATFNIQPNRLSTAAKRFSVLEGSFSTRRERFCGSVKRFCAPEKRFCAPQKLPCAPEKRFYAPQKRFYAPEKRFYAPQKRSTASERSSTEPQKRFYALEKRFCIIEKRLRAPPKCFFKAGKSSGSRFLSLFYITNTRR